MLKKTWYNVNANQFNSYLFIHISVNRRSVVEHSNYIIRCKKIWCFYCVDNSNQRLNLTNLIWLNESWNSTDYQWTCTNKKAKHIHLVNWIRSSFSFSPFSIIIIITWILTSLHTSLHHNKSFMIKQNRQKVNQYKNTLNAIHRIKWTLSGFFSQNK